MGNQAGEATLIKELLQWNRVNVDVEFLFIFVVGTDAAVVEIMLISSKSLSACLSFCLSVHLSFCLSACLSFCLSVHLSFCLLPMIVNQNLIYELSKYQKMKFSEISRWVTSSQLFLESRIILWSRSRFVFVIFRRARQKDCQYH